MTHDDYRALIQRELDEELSDEEAKLLEAHVATCVDCRLERADYQKLLTGLSALSQLRPERSFVDQMLPDLANFTTPPATAPATARKRRQAYWWRGLSAAGAAAVVLIAAAHGNFWKSGQQSAPSQAQAPTQQTASGLPKSAQTDATNGGTTAAPPQAFSKDTGSTKSQEPVPSSNGNGTAASPAANDSGAVPSHPLIVADATPAGAKTLKQAALSPSGSTSASAKQSSESGQAMKQSPDSTSQKTQPTSGVAQLRPGNSTSGTGAVGQGGLAPHSSLAGSIVPLNVVGPVQNLPADLNAMLQADAEAGQAAWATDPTEVVERHLNALGFSQTADVTATPDVGCVQVAQGGAVFLVTLTQPYAQGPEGIWVPVQIGRIVEPGQLQPMDQPIVQYFSEQQAAGAIVSVDRLEELQQNDSQVIVQATLLEKNPTGGSQAVTRTYRFSVVQKADGSYALNGTPQVQ